MIASCKGLIGQPHNAKFGSVPPGHFVDDCYDNRNVYIRYLPVSTGVYVCK